MSDDNTIYRNGVSITALLLVTALTARACSPKYGYELDVIREDIKNAENSITYPPNQAIQGLDIIDSNGNNIVITKAPNGVCFATQAPQ